VFSAFVSGFLAFIIQKSVFGIAELCFGCAHPKRRITRPDFRCARLKLSFAFPDFRCSRPKPSIAHPDFGIANPKPSIAHLKSGRAIRKSNSTHPGSTFSIPFTQLAGNSGKNK
jgi:hypothetical protein